MIVDLIKQYDFPWIVLNPGDHICAFYRGSDGRNEIKGETLVYSMHEERVVASAEEQGSQRVRIVINPKSLPGKTPQP